MVGTFHPSKPIVASRSYQNPVTVRPSAGVGLALLSRRRYSICLVAVGTTRPTVGRPARPKHDTPSEGDTMGRGDQRSRKGKISRGSYGNSRPKKKKSGK
ncbi:MAG: 30S ribosomal protein THX [Planctomycetota bacterium]